PPGAALFVDGEAKGRAPAAGLELPRGPRKVRLELEGYEPVEAWAEVKAGSETRIERRLSREQGTVDLTSSVPEVMVTLRPEGGGEPVTAVTNVRGLRLDTGAWTVVFSKVNYFPEERRLAVARDRPVALHADLHSRRVWEIATPSTLKMVEVADLDGDGEFEIVISSQDTRVGAILEVRGLPSFVEKWSFRQDDFFTPVLQENIYAFTLTDLDRDGVLEVLASGPKSVLAFDGATGRRRFERAVHSVRRRAVADVDRDGRPDLLLGTSYLGLCAHGLASADPLWTYRPEGMDYVCTTPWFGDADGDGRPEVIIGSRDGALRCLRARDGAEAWTMRDADLWMADPCLADYDGDGRTDLAWTTRGGRFRLADPATGGPRGNWDLGKPWSGPTLPLDPDRDGSPDFFAVTEVGEIGRFAVRPGGPALLWSRSLEGSALTLPVLCDLDGDGALEAVLLCPARSLVLVVGADGDERARFRAEGTPLSVQPADLDDDGDLELVVATERSVAAFRVRSRPEILEIETGHPHEQPVLPGDFDGDGKLDYLFDRESILEAWDGAERRPMWRGPPGDWRDVIATPADVDGDGDQDLVVARGYKNAVCVLEGRSGAILWERQTGSAAYTPARVADLDADGKPEAVVFTRRGELLCLAAADGREKWSENLGAGIHPPAVADVDGDGRPEVVVDVPGRRPVVLVLDGATGREEARAEFRNRSTTATVACDVDGDGRADLFHGCFTGLFRRLDGRGRVVWKARHGLSPVHCTPVVRDVDGDGSAEVVYSTNDGSAFCLDAATGALKWSGRLGMLYGQNSLLPAVLDGVPSLLGFDDRGLVALDAKTGRARLSLETFGRVRSTPVLADLDGDGRADLLAYSPTGTLFRVEDFERFASRHRRPLGPLFSHRDLRDPLLARTLHRTERRGDAEGLARACAEAGAMGPDFLHLRLFCEGKVALLRGQWAEAARKFREALDQGSWIPGLRPFLASALLRTGEAPEADRRLREAL
ncbi:MAG: FG-GAP-like repeat-containing protein, partial [Planctomycetes bacterium]|nr:FG-GAP-like repeat-containing protein [Planctomycetota bacterium]